MDQLVNVLYQITVALKIPVIIGLMIALAWVLFEIGRFLREWIDRMRAQQRWNRYLALIPRRRSDASGLRDEFFALGRYPTLPALFAAQARAFPDDPDHLDKLICDIEIEANRRCYRMRVGVRVGPILGLMGTLIPMGPALLSISTGNLAAMSENLIIAFSTTVTGLLIGGLSLIMLFTRQHWYAKDMADIEHVNLVAFSSQGRA